MALLLPAVCALALLASGTPPAPTPAAGEAGAPAPDDPGGRQTASPPLDVPRLAPPLTAPLVAPGEPAADRRYHVERIELRGLSHAREEEVRRHLLVAPGDALDNERVLLSRLRLLYRDVSREWRFWRRAPSKKGE